MGLGKSWTPEEERRLEELWGHRPLQNIAEEFGRSPNAIKIRVARLGLGAFLDSGEYITFNQLLKATGVGGSYGYKDISLIKNREFPVKFKTVNACKFRVVYLEDFWRWAEDNRTVIDWTKFEENILGKEPPWVKEQRRLSFQAKRTYRTTPWSSADDDQLRYLLRQYKYTGAELAGRLRRTEGAVIRRISTLGLTERPLKADNHTAWSEDAYHRLGEMIKQGHAYETMSLQLGRSVKAIRGRVFAMYLTENLDKARRLIGARAWGDNRPDRVITHTTLTTDERKAVKSNIAALAGVVQARVRAIYDADDYWQKDLCMHWDGQCKAGETNCDACTSFQRIRPQYCVRCGREFLKRTLSKICDPCTAARKKQAQRKWARMHQRGGIEDDTSA